ncbi:PREDICTED: uncharacterized protein LOC109589855, partial [Amphimedon queenslandica]|uniref:Uncharacterized protein n=2 Tax=Amphimedon queenslandica TaxID=400682 RepID=A0AAN0JW59_AMPQE
ITHERSSLASLRHDPVVSEFGFINDEKDLESVDELVTLRSQFNEMEKKNKELSDTLDGAKIKYRASLSASSFNDTAASRLRKGMALEINDLKFHLKAINSPNYQPLVEDITIKELQQEITLLYTKLVTERQHKEQILKEIYETSMKIEQPSQEVTLKSEGKSNKRLLSEEDMQKNYGNE